MVKAQAIGGLEVFAKEMVMCTFAHTDKLKILKCEMRRLRGTLPFGTLTPGPI